MNARLQVPSAAVVCCGLLAVVILDADRRPETGLPFASTSVPYRLIVFHAGVAYADVTVADSGHARPT
jgi:hypothetical protein